LLLGQSNYSVFITDLFITVKQGNSRPLCGIQDQPPAVLDESVGRAVALCREHHVRLWVNDYWGLAVKHKAYGLHIGQEDLVDLLAQVGESCWLSGWWWWWWWGGAYRFCILWLL
jgi:hypothetical protein